MERKVHSRNFDNSKRELNSLKESPCRKYNIRMSLFRWIMLDVIYIGVLRLVDRPAKNILYCCEFVTNMKNIGFKTQRPKE